MATISPRAQVRLLRAQEREEWKAIIRKGWAERDRPVIRASIKIAIIQLRRNHTQTELAV